jgi:serine/threonine-protein kinase
LLATVLIGVTAAVLPRTDRPAAPNGESEGVRQDLETELDAGRPVNLVGETGWPKWFCWRAGKEAQRTHIEPDGTFSAEMLDRHVTGLLELLPDSRIERFKLTAQVRHDLGGPAAFVGLYVGHRTYARFPRDMQLFAQARFNAVSPVPRVITLPIPRQQLPENETRRIALGLRLYVDHTVPTDMDGFLEETYGPRMTASGPRNGVWHDLEVTVTPDQITALVDNNRVALPSGTLSAEAVQQGFASIRELWPEDPFVQNFDPEFTARGGIGLVLYPLSAASVRRVNVTPLPRGP